MAFSTAVSEVTAGQPKVQRSSYQATGAFPIVDQGQTEVAGYTSDEKLLFKGALPAIVFGDHTRLIKFVDYPFAIGADGAKVLTPKRVDLEPGFLYHYLCSVDIPSRGYSRHMKFLRTVEVPIPPILEQRRIVEILNHANRIRRLRRDAVAKARELIPALFIQMFGDPASNPRGWEQASFEELGTLDRGRSRHRPRDAEELYGGPYPFVQTGDVANSNGHIRGYSQTYSEIGLAQSRLWPADTLCITIAANIAKTGLLEFDACFPDSVVGFNPGQMVTVAYVQTWLSFLQPVLEASAPQAAQKNINLKILRALPVPVPPIALQHEFAERAHDIQRLVSQHEQQAAEAEALHASLLSQCFQ